MLYAACVIPFGFDMNVRFLCYSACGVEEETDPTFVMGRLYVRTVPNEPDDPNFVMF